MSSKINYLRASILVTSYMVLLLFAWATRVQSEVQPAQTQIINWCDAPLQELKAEPIEKVEEVKVKETEVIEEVKPNPQVEHLRKFFAKYNPKLVAYAEQIVQLPRWHEAVGITGKETTFCKFGVGASKNNCGGIKSPKTGQFKAYATAYDSIADIAYLLDSKYKGISIANMNGRYCVDETQPDNKCVGWAEAITKYASMVEA